MGEEDARACRDLDDAACHEVPGNFGRMLVAHVLARLGDVAFNARSVLPWLAVSVGAPPWLAAWFMPVRESLSMLPQLLLGAWIRARPVRKWFYALGSLIQGMMAAAVVLVAVTLSGTTAGLAMLGCVVVFSLARALCSLSQKDVLGKTIPKGQRGRLMGLASSVGGAAAMLAGGVLASGPQSSTTIFLMLAVAALCWFATARVYARIEETPGETDGGADGIALALPQLRRLHHDPAFLRFMVARGLLLSSALMAPWLVLLAGGEGGAETLAGFIVAEGIAGLIATPIWGRLADGSSPRVMAAGGAIAALVGLSVGATAFIAPGQLQVACIAGFLVLSVGHAGVRLGRKTWVVDHGDGNERTARVAVANSMTGLLLLGTGALGLLASVWSTSALVVVLAVAAIAGAVTALTLPAD